MQLYELPHPRRLSPRRAFGEWRDPARLRPFFALLLREGDPLADFEAVEARLSDAVAMEIDFPPIGALQETIAILRHQFSDHARLRLRVMLHFAAHAPHLILQLTAGPVECVVEGEVEILMAFVLMRRAVDVDLPLVRETQMNLDFIGSTGMAMAARRPDRDVACGDAAIAFLEARQVMRYFVTELGRGLHSVEVDVRRAFHVILFLCGGGATSSIARDAVQRRAPLPVQGARELLSRRLGQI